MFLDDTIVAISSTVGPSARMIVRVSGAEAGKLLGVLEVGVLPSDNSTARFCPISFSGLKCWAWVYRFISPGSYTGQDLVELHIPGNPLLGRMLVDSLAASGARLAEAGEFTARAWFNGKIDLTQAEGVAAAIAAGSRQQLVAARQLMAGELSRRLKPAMELLAETLALIEAGIDFSDEGLDFLPAGETNRRLNSLIVDLSALLDQTSRLDSLSREPRIVLAGRPNAGKSTLTNALAGFGRSIVSAIAGTTRDAVSVEVMLPRGVVRLIDIAGLEESQDAMDEISVQMRQQAMRAIEESDVLVLVHDATDGSGAFQLPRTPDLTVLSKIDLRPGVTVENGQLPVSATTGLHLDALRIALDRLAFGSSAGGASLALGVRHIAAINQSVEAIQRGQERISAGAGELIAADLREALDALGQVLGSISPDDILGRIFSTFCIGK